MLIQGAACRMLILLVSKGTVIEIEVFGLLGGRGLNVACYYTVLSYLAR